MERTVLAPPIMHVGDLDEDEYDWILEITRQINSLKYKYPFVCTVDFRQSHDEDGNTLAEPDLSQDAFEAQVELRQWLLEEPNRWYIRMGRPSVVRINMVKEK